MLLLVRDAMMRLIRDAMIRLFHDDLEFMGKNVCVWNNLTLAPGVRDVPL